MHEYGLILFLTNALIFAVVKLVKCDREKREIKGKLKDMEKSLESYKGKLKDEIQETRFWRDKVTGNKTKKPLKEDGVLDQKVFEEEE